MSGNALLSRLLRLRALKRTRPNRGDAQETENDADEPEIQPHITVQNVG